REIVADRELALDLLQITDVQRAGEDLAAPRAAGALTLGACAPVEVERELRGALEDVKELPEGEVEEREDHRDGVELREEAVVVAAQPVRGDGEQEAGDRDREEQEEGEQVGRELLDGERAAVPRASPEREADADDHERSGDVEHVEDERGERAREREAEDAKAEDVGVVRGLRVPGRLEADPAERERERDRGGEQAAPEDARVRGPPARRAVLDELLREQVVPGEPREPRDVARKAARREEELEAAPEVAARG